MRQLYTTGVPLRFECEYACVVEDCSKVEKAFHHAFGNCRINSSREFFTIEPERVIAVLELLSISNVTPKVGGYLSENVTPEEKFSAKKMKSSRRSNMNFSVMGLPIGSILIFKDGNTSVKIVEEKKVELGGDVCSLTAATKKLMNTDYSVQPAPYWTFEGRTLKDIYEETYILNE
ncbi:MAG TPA: GIY-YIG nuclease family protein [Ghiorsea sp.]|nr:GIY-YIG nuclease family protein [Ghiorsea sp.]HIP07740.1 GIY-YIG nuclease family protein [Mariprofundaceae bacterium]